ncbi:MAG: hypothetical protein NTY19_17605 [Planctomycetota bacterium]|nr:hypothetical protein [Planctomycetota bacterium]
MKDKLSESEREVWLDWRGPFEFTADGELTRCRGCVSKRPPSGSGIYLATGDQPLYGRGVLMYIGRTRRGFNHRLPEHEWLCSEWSVEIYAATVDEALIDDVERLLIYVHSPLYNCSNVSEPPRLASPLRIFNIGRFWGLYPEVSSRHAWANE